MTMTVHVKLGAPPFMGLQTVSENLEDVTDACRLMREPVTLLKVERENVAPLWLVFSRRELLEMAESCEVAPRPVVANDTLGGKEPA